MPPDLFQMGHMHMKTELEQILGFPVALFHIHKHLKALLKRRIDDGAIYVLV